MVLCAAEALQIVTSRAGLKPFLRGAPVFALVLVALTTGASFLFGANGQYARSGRNLHDSHDCWHGSARTFRCATLREWAPAAVAFGVLLSTYLVIPPNCGVPKYNLSQDLLKAAPLDPARLYLSVYPAAEIIYRTESKPRPIGQITRPGSTSMLAGLHFVNGYSPILASGVAKEFGFAIHGEFDWATQKKLLEEEAGGGGLLDRLGVDGIVVASESGLRPLPVNEWDVAVRSEEGIVYHRHLPSDKVTLLMSYDAASTGLRSVRGYVSAFHESRTSVSAVITSSAPIGKEVSFSRPYFRGYHASLDGREVPITAWKGLSPQVDLPPGLEDKVVLTYRPWWLVWGGAAAICCLVVLLIGVILLFVSPKVRALE